MCVRGGRGGRVLFPILAKIGEGVCPFQNPLEIPENTAPQRGSEIAVAPGGGWKGVWFDL